MRHETETESGLRRQPQSLHCHLLRENNFVGRDLSVVCLSLDWMDYVRAGSQVCLIWTNAIVNALGTSPGSQTRREYNDRPVKYASSSSAGEIGPQ